VPRDGRHDRQRRPGGEEGGQRADPRPAEQPAEQRAGQPAEAVTRVERGHQRVPAAPLHLTGLRVHRHVQRPGRDAEREQRDHQRHHVLGQAERDRQQCDGNAGYPGQPGTPERIDQPPGQQHDEHQASRCREQRDT
jgi:hypothetical protein